MLTTSQILVDRFEELKMSNPRVVTAPHNLSRRVKEKP